MIGGNTFGEILKINTKIHQVHNGMINLYVNLIIKYRHQKKCRTCALKKMIPDNPNPQFCCQDLIFLTPILRAAAVWNISATGHENLIPSAHGCLAQSQPGCT